MPPTPMIVLSFPIPHKNIFYNRCIVQLDKVLLEFICMHKYAFKQILRVSPTPHLNKLNLLNHGGKGLLHLTQLLYISSAKLY